MESLSKKNIDRLSELAVNAAEPLGLVILRLTARGVPSRPVIEVILDGSRLVKVDDCEAIGKILNAAIESEKLAGGNYRLDVLSPGLDEPIIHDYQFQRTIGHLVEIKYSVGVTQPERKSQTISGILKDFSPDEIIISKRQKKKNADEEAERIHIKREEIDSIYARPDFG
jgi:ribosome maturation factor RimP